MSEKVLMFGWEFPPHNSGGLGVACEGLARALAENGVQLTFVLPRRMSLGKTPHRIVFADIPEIKTRNVDSILSPYITSGKYNALQSGIAGGLYGSGLFEEIKRYALAARAIAEKEDFDLIHAHDWLSFLAGAEARAASGKPLIIHVHITGWEQAGGGSVDPRVYAVEREGMQRADAIIAVSERTKHIIVEKYGIAPGKIHVLHNGITLTAHAERDFSKTQGKILRLKERGNNIVLFLGRLTLHKGPDYFIRAARRVLDYEPNTYFVIAGSGDMEGQIMQEAAGLGIGDKVLFAGFVREENRDELYRSADLYVLPSVAEPFGITPLESLGNGTPVLISKQSGVSEVITHSLKVDFWDTDEMANKIISVLRHKPLKQQLASSGFQEALKATWEKAALKCREIYRKCIHAFKMKHAHS